MNAHLPRIGNYAIVQMRISRGSGTARSYKCASPQDRELRDRTNAHLPRIGNYAIVQMRISPGSGTARSYKCASPQDRELRDRTNAHLPRIGNYAIVQMRISRGSGTTPSYKCASPQDRELRDRTNAHLPRIGNYAIVQMRISRGSGTTRSYKCVSPEDRELPESALTTQLGDQVPAAGTRWPGLVPAAAGLAAVAAGSALAIWGLNFGLPYLFRPDEDVLVGRSVRMAAEGSIDPLFANWPPLAFYIVAGAEKLTGNLGGATLGDPSGAYMTGRVLSAAAFVATIALVFGAARRAHGGASAVIAAFTLALAPLAVRQAHMATIDFIQTAFVGAALLAGLRARSVGGFAVAGALCGLAAATKYTGGLSIVFVLAMALQSGQRTRMVSASAAGAAVAFAIPSSVTLAHAGAYASGLAFLGGRGFAQDYGTPPGWVYHTTVSLPFGMGLGGYALAL